MNYIELFAGCGGLSLGLQSSGFELLLANEISPMAAETYARNILGFNSRNKKNIEKIFWLKSLYSRSEIDKRLRENPFLVVPRDRIISDIILSEKEVEKYKNSLFVGSIVDLNEMLSQSDNLLTRNLKSGFSSGRVDLVSGGPPCQSFSMAGLRKGNNSRNDLPWEFANFVSIIRPRIALLENVTGILQAFKVGNKKIYAWIEVARAFAEIGYLPLCFQVDAKYVGAAQSRSRFILIAVESKVAKEVSKNCNESVIEKAISVAEVFVAKVKEGKDTTTDDIKCHKIKDHDAIFSTDIFRPLRTHESRKFVGVKDAIDDMRSQEISESKYVKSINSTFVNKHRYQLNKLLNHDFRKNGKTVQARFRLNQVISSLTSDEGIKVKSVLNYKTNVTLGDDITSKISKKWLLKTDGNFLKNGSHDEILQLIDELRTKKHSQRALVANQPAPAVLGSPDDSSHYFEDKKNQRTLTVREIARIQTFPDWFEFKSKITTGGKYRKYEVPQYTQVGNAVPPLLGLALGKVCENILSLDMR